MLAEHYRELPLPDLHGSSLTASEPALIYSVQKLTHWRWLLRAEHVITLRPIYHHPNRARAPSLGC